VLNGVTKTKEDHMKIGVIADLDTFHMDSVIPFVIVVGAKESEKSVKEMKPWTERR